MVPERDDLSSTFRHSVKTTRPVITAAENTERRIDGTQRSRRGIFKKMHSEMQAHYVSDCRTPQVVASRATTRGLLQKTFDHGSAVGRSFERGTMTAGALFGTATSFGSIERGSGVLRRPSVRTLRQRLQRDSSIHETIDIELDDGVLRLRIYIDKSMVGCFLNDRKTVTTRPCPGWSDADGPRLFYVGARSWCENSIQSPTSYSTAHGSQFREAIFYCSGFIMIYHSILSGGNNQTPVSRHLLPCRPKGTVLGVSRCSRVL